MTPLHTDSPSFAIPPCGLPQGGMASLASEGSAKMPRGLPRGASLTLTKLAMAAIADKKGYDIAAYDVRQRSAITDYIVIATASNPPHLKALLNETRLRFKGNGVFGFRISGTPDSGWIVADYLDVMVHLFLPEIRDYYALDQLLQDTPRVNV